MTEKHGEIWWCGKGPIWPILSLNIYYVYIITLSNKIDKLIQFIDDDFNFIGYSFHLMISRL